MAKKPAIPQGNMAGFSQQQIDMLKEYGKKLGIEWWQVTQEDIAAEDKRHKDQPSGYKAGDENLTDAEIAAAKERAKDNALRGPKKVDSGPDRSATKNTPAQKPTPAPAGEQKSAPAKPLADYVQQNQDYIAQYSATPDTYSDQVKAIQKGLMNAGYNVGKEGPDGYWGDKTAAAMEAAGLKTEARGGLTEQRAAEILKYLEDQRAKKQAGYNS